VVVVTGGVVVVVGKVVVEGGVVVVEEGVTVVGVMVVDTSCRGKRWYPKLKAMTGQFLG
jgi:hypothetical protein